MVECSRSECVLLHLSAYEDTGSSPADPATSIGGICDALDVGAETMADRIAVLTALSDLAETGLVEKRTTAVEGTSGKQTVYGLTDEGRDRAGRIRERLRGERIVVETDGGRSEIDIEAVDQYFDESPLARAVSRLRDGVLRFREGGGEGIVDREAEMERFQADVSAVQSGDPRTVLVRGQGGIGKTTLVREVTERARENGFDVHWGSSKRGAQEAYGPLRSALADALPDGDDPFDRVRAAPDDEGEFESRRSSLFHDVVEAFESLAEQSPIAVVIDDVHRVASPTLDLIEHVSRHVDGPVLLVGTHRYEDLPDDHPLSDPRSAGWPAPDRTTWIHLDPLGPEDTRTLIERQVGRVDVPETFRDRVYEETGGSPLFVEETIKSLLDDGRIDATHGVYPDPDASLPTPERVESVVADRLDVLDEVGMDVLERAAVVGEGVPFGILTQVTDRQEQAVREYVAVLEDSLVLQWEDDETLRFTSAVIRKTVLEGIEDGRRRELHERIADAYLSGDDPSDAYVTVAEHYERAGEAEAALEYYRQAAGEAKDVYANELAVDNYERALGLAREMDRDEVALDVIRSIAEVHYVSGNHEEAERHFQYVRERTDNPAERLRIAYHLVNVCRVRGDHERGIEIADAALENWDETPDPSAARLVGEKGRCLRNLGDLDGAVALFDRQSEIGEALDDDLILGYAAHNRGLVALDRGSYDDGIDIYREAIDYLERAGDRIRLARAYNNKGVVYNRDGDFQRATEDLRKCLEIQREIGDEVGAAVTEMNLGAINFARGRLDEARSSYETAIAADRKLGQTSSLAFSTGNLADLFVVIGEMEEAGRHFRKCLDLYGDSGPSRYRANFTIRYAHYEYLRDEFEAAAEDARRGHDVAEDAGAKNERADALEILGLIERDRGNLESAVDTHERFFEVSGEIDSLEQEVQAHVALGGTYLAADRRDEALDHARQAVEVAGRTNGVWLPLDAKKLLGKCLRDREQYDRAESQLSEVLERARELGNRALECDTLYDLGSVYDRRGNRQRAADVLSEARTVAETDGFTLYGRKARELLERVDGGKD